MKKHHLLYVTIPLFFVVALLVSCAPPQEKATPRVGVIYIDAGHGGFDTGAVGVTAEGEEIVEKDIALDVALRAGAALEEQGYTVLYARRGDERLTYTTARDEVIARRAAAEEAGVDLYLSIHGNAYAGTGRAYGARVYYNPACVGGEGQASALAAAVTECTGAPLGRDCAIVPDGSYYVLADSDLPALLFEVGFLSDREELSLLATPDYRASLAAAICRAVDEILAKQ